MRGNTPLRWIAEAEARRLRDLAVSQGAGMTTVIGAAGPEIAPLWRVWLAKTLSRVPLASEAPAAREQGRRG
jgi:hypothetical protein